MSVYQLAVGVSTGLGCSNTFSVLCRLVHLHDPISHELYLLRVPKDYLSKESLGELGQAVGIVIDIVLCADIRSTRERKSACNQSIHGLVIYHLSTVVLLIL